MKPAGFISSLDTQVVRYSQLTLGKNANTSISFKQTNVCYDQQAKLLCVTLFYSKEVIIIKLQLIISDCYSCQKRLAFQLAITRQCPLIGSQALACPLQLQPAQVPRQEPPGTRSKPEEHISQDRPEYPGGHLGMISMSQTGVSINCFDNITQITTPQIAIFPNVVNKTAQSKYIFIFWGMFAFYQIVQVGDTDNNTNREKGHWSETRFWGMANKLSLKINSFRSSHCIYKFCCIIVQHISLYIWAHWTHPNRLL